MIKGVNSGPYSTPITGANEAKAGRKSVSQSSTEETGVILDIGNSGSKSPVYGKPTGKLNAEEINRLWEQTEKATQSLRDLVEKLIGRQGKKVRDAQEGEEPLIIDDEAKAEAERLISEDGEWGVKAVSTRIVDFAKAVSGGDKSKLDEIRSAIDEGFKQAEKALGGALPDISKKTYDEVMKRLDDWENEE